MAALIRQSTAVTILFGPFLDDTDGKTAETALSIAAAEILVGKHNSGFTTKNDGTVPTHNSSGWYLVTLNATDTNTVGQVIIACHKAGALPVWREFMVVPAMVFDSLVTGGDFLQVDACQFLGANVTAAGGIPAVNATQVKGVDAMTQIRDAVFNGVVENSKTFVQMVRGLCAAAFGKASGLDTDTAVYRDNADTKARITATTDDAGNRSAVTTDLS